MNLQKEIFIKELVIAIVSGLLAAVLFFTFRNTPVTDTEGDKEATVLSCVIKTDLFYE